MKRQLLAILTAAVIVFGGAATSGCSSEQSVDLYFDDNGAVHYLNPATIQLSEGETSRKVEVVVTGPSQFDGRIVTLSDTPIEFELKPVGEAGSRVKGSGTANLEPGTYSLALDGVLTSGRIIVIAHCSTRGRC